MPIHLLIWGGLLAEKFIIVRARQKTPNLSQKEIANVPNLNEIICPVEVCKCTEIYWKLCLEGRSIEKFTVAV